MKNLQKNFSYTFIGKVWRIEAEASGQYLLLEVRDEASFSTRFFIYNPSTYQLIGEEITLEENWWVGCTYFFEDIILFHTFADSENPDQKSYLAYDIEDRKMLWEKSDVLITALAGNHVSVRRLEADRAHTIDLRTGEIVEGGIDKEFPKNNFYQFPFHYSPGSEYHQTVTRFLDTLGIECDKSFGVDYLEGNSWVIVSYYIKHEYLENRLVVLDLQKNVLLMESLGKQLKGIADRPFFVYHSNLIFVKENSDFLSFQLSQK